MCHCKTLALLGAILLWLSPTVSAQKISAGIGMEISKANPIINIGVPLSENQAVSLTPIIRVGTQDVGLLDHFQLGFRYSQQKMALNGDVFIINRDSDESYSGNGNLKLGISQLDIELNVFLMNKKTRPYLKAGLGVFLPVVKVDGSVSADEERVDVDLANAMRQLSNSSFGLSKRFVGVGAEHRLNDHLVLFIEWTLPTTTVKGQLDIEEGIEAINEVLLDLNQEVIEDGLDGSIDLKLKLSSSKTALGLMMYF